MSNLFFSCHGMGVQYLVFMSMSICGGHCTILFSLVMTWISTPNLVFPVNVMFWGSLSNLVFSCHDMCVNT